MKILAIDTSSKICSVAILEKDEMVDEINLDNGQTHSENLMPMVARILSNHNMNLSDIDLISCCIGPGSFTGIRIGVASVKAMAEVNGIPIVSVSSLEMLARLDESQKTKVALIDARNNQVYCGIFDNHYHAMEEFMADDITKVLEIMKKYNPIICIGDGAILHKNCILEMIPNAEFCEKNEQKSAFGGKIAYQKFLKKDVQNADTIMPMYLRKSQAERMKKA